jgi:uncharacterized membrane protein YhaH (DUF805 family)
MNLRPSIVTTKDGWTWLSPSRRGAQLRQAFWSVVLSLMLVMLAAAATLPPRLIAVPLVAVLLGSGIWLTRTLWNRSHSAVAVSDIGIAVRGGFDVAQIGWPALDAVVGVPHGDRIRIVVEARGARHQTHVTFAREAALSWLAMCAEHASRRRLRLQPVEGMEGFRAG